MSCTPANGLRFLARVLCVSLFGAGSLSNAFAQRGGLNDPSSLNQVMLSYDTAPGTGVLIFNVYAERSSTHLDRQALLKLVHPVDRSVTFQTTEGNAQGVFTNIPYGDYEVEVSAVGYLSEHKELKVMNSVRPLQMDVVLHHDPAAINLDGADTVMSPKARKDAKRAIALLKSGNLADAQKQLDRAYQQSPSSPDLNFLLGYLYFQKKDFGQAGNYLGTAASLSPHNAQALTLLGRAGLERHDYPAARSELEEAVLADAENWLPHNLLADAYLHQKDYGKARDEAQIALIKGQRESSGVTSPARLVLGQALVGLGHDQEGIQALTAFLDESPRHPLAGEVRTLISEIKGRDSESESAGGTTITERHISGVDPLAAMSVPPLSVRAWQPPGVDDIPPAVASTVACPSWQVIEESGKRVQEFVEDVARFAAVEDLFHQALDTYGIPVRTETRKYNYVASISEPELGSISVDEYRAEKLTLAGYPDQIASTGFAALALVFHPHMRDSFVMTCEGLGDWHGQASWLVHFRQRDDRPGRMQSYKVGNRIRAVDLKGRAWITAGKFQIVRIEAEMVRPMPEIQLLSEHQVVEYGPVPFPKKNAALWLPKSAEIYFDFRKHRYYRRHTFDHYMLYSVDTDEKRKEPASKPSHPKDS
jgi:tetratricopeptide (TPR) repeat protein